MIGARLLRAKLRGIVRASRGVALIEFAFIFPIVIYVILGLVELANYAIVRQRISQVALQVADNGGRIGEVGLSGASKISEKQIHDVLMGGIIQGGNLEMMDRGRIILSSLERNSGNRQFIHWQKCIGGLAYASTFGREGDGASGRPIQGMGRSESMIVAEEQQPVMFVEVAYRIRPIALDHLLPAGPITETASMPIRIERDLSGLIESTGAERASCT